MVPFLGFSYNAAIYSYRPIKYRGRPAQPLTIPRLTLTSTLLQLVVTGTTWVVRSEVVLAVAHSTVLVLLSGIGYVPVLSREILLWRAAYLASLGACLWVMRAGARHLLWCILGSQGAKHAALASCGVAGKPC